ncbi:migration and invasion-inhibitory protein isoform X2 [Electrophorus electricus]|uniref:migration and invasion-inhibitory protein isoform X2 n=1 Tax=Electrophorus electricus TaxID=8005 RepID=UPI0015CFEA24|nr:migration and invasion-inhibitory protein isoform X2 [Electrophorus electricus]
MCSVERLDVLRKQNKELLKKLKNQSEKFQSLTTAYPCKGEQKHSSSGSVFETRDEPQRGARRLSVSDAVVTFGASHPNPARDALQCLASEVCKASTPTGHVSRPSEDTTHSHLLQDRGKRPPHGQSVDMEQKPSVSTGVSLDRDWGVTSLSPGQQLETEHERQLIQPLLGYDWIAGLLDAESSLTERSEQFFSELRSFRQVNKDECVHSTSSGLPVVPVTLSSPVESEHAHASDSHQCTFCYQINSRLFAVPLGSQAACPICKMPKAKHPHDEQEPAFVRVSIPRSTLLPAYRYKARRRSFDPSDSLGLSSHCLSGWSNSTLKLSSQMSSLDLRSSVEVGLTKLIATSALCNNRPVRTYGRVFNYGHPSLSFVFLFSVISLLSIVPLSLSLNYGNSSTTSRGLCSFCAHDGSVTGQTSSFMAYSTLTWVNPQLWR